MKNLRACRNRIRKLFPLTFQDAHVLKNTFGNLHGIYRVRAHFVESIKIDDRLNGQEISHPSFSKKTFLSTLLSACDYVLQFNFKIAHIADSVNTAADFLSRLELKVTGRSASKSGKMYKQCPLMSQHPP